MLDKRILEQPKVKKKVDEFMSRKKELAEVEKQNQNTPYVRFLQKNVATIAMELAGILAEAEIELLKRQ